MMRTRSLQFEAIGTHWQIDAHCDLSSQLWDEICCKIHERIDFFDQTYSRFRDDSFVTKLTTTGGVYELPADAYPLLSLYERLYRATNGSFTPLIGNLLSDSGYDATYTLEEKPLRSPSLWDDVLKYDRDTLTIKSGEILDFGAGGKGYLVDIISQLLTNHGIETHCVDAGGDIVQKSSENNPTRVGLEHPLATDTAIGVVELCNESIAGSSGNRRTWGKYHHIFDPKTKMSTQEVLATWVVADSGLLADSLATCLFLVDPALLKSFSFEYLIVYPDLSIKRSSGFPAELFVA